MRYVLAAAAAALTLTSTATARTDRGDTRWCDRHHACKQRVERRQLVELYRDRLHRIARCESGGNPRAVSASGTYRGLLQFDYRTWREVGGQGDPAAATRHEQLYRGALLYRKAGPGRWPICGRR